MFAAIPFPEIDPFVFQLPGFELFGLNIPSLGLRWYALAYIAGLVLGWRYVAMLVARERLWPRGARPMEPSETDDLLLWMTVGVVLGGRLGFILFYAPETIWTEPEKILRIWEGGMAFHGGMIGVILAVLGYSWRNSVPALSLGDAVACATPIGLFFGRIANFINGELWGRPTDVSWGVIFPQVEYYVADYPWLAETVGQPRHPSQLYEAATEGLLLFAILAYLAWRTDALKRPGTCIGVFLIGYGLARGICEFFRQYNVELGFDLEILGVGVTRGQLLCVPMIIAGVAFLAYARRQRRLQIA